MGAKLVRAGGAVLLGLFAGSCGGAATPSAALVGSDPVDASRGTAEVKKAPDRPLSPADAPPGLVVRARMAGFSALADEMLAAAGVPFDWRKSLAEQGDDAQLLMGALDLAAPVEAMVALNPQPQREPFAALSLGSPGVQASLAALDAYQVDAQEGPGGIFYFAYEDADCALGRSLGPSPARIVCADREESLQRLLPYALRGLPAEKLTESLLHVDFDVRPIRAVYGKQARALKVLATVAARRMQTQTPRFDNAATDALVALAEEAGDLLQDTDQVTLRLGRTETGLRYRMGVRMSGEASWTSQVVTALAARQAVAPDSFNRLMSTASSAGYGRHIPERQTARMSRILQDLVGGGLEHEGKSLATVRRAEALVEEFFADEGPSISASGPLVAEKVEGETRLASAWSLWGSQRSERSVAQAFDDLQGLLGAEEIRSEAPDDLPTLKRELRALPGVPGAILYRWEWPGVFDESLGSLDEGPFDFGSFSWLEAGYFAIKEVEGTTWIAMGRSVDQVAEPLRALRASNTARLADRRELEPLRSRPAVAAGFAKVEGLVAWVSPLLPQSISSGWPSLLRATPHSGEVPGYYFIEAKTGAVTELSFTQEIPGELLADLASLVVIAATDQ